MDKINKTKMKLTPNVLLMAGIIVMLFVVSNKIDSVLMLLGQ